MLSHLQVQEGYEISVVAGPDLVDYPMFATLDHMGRLFVFESIGDVYGDTQEALDNPQFRIKLLTDLDSDGIYDQATIFADKLSFPQGGVFYQGSLIASSAPDLLKLTDTDGDGIADEREVIMSGWTLDVNANSLIGPFMGPDGWLYMTNAIKGFDVQSLEGEHLKGETARIWRLRPDGSDLEWISAGGMNNPVELAFTPAAEVLGTQTFFIAPQKGLRDALTYWVEGGVYGKKNSNISRDRLPLTGELMPVVSQYSRVAPSGLGSYRGTVLGEDFQHNLFSTQFNAHAVLRHQLLREGASFRTEDEAFLWSDHEDFHPTDVLEDADGSLLVVETGGWFILGCPLSQVSKPKLKGHIYRIRRTGAEQRKDPYGNAISWAELSADDLVALLEDARPFVRDRAGEALLEKGQEAIPPLSGILETSSSTDARIAATFALSHIGTEQALEKVRKALEDQEEEVRIAAARSLGLAKDPKAVAALLSSLKDPDVAVKRQSATALGQIGSSQAAQALLETAANSEDRFLDHAITYSLLQLGQYASLQKALKHSSWKVRRIALIALDQLPDSPLGPSDIRPFLAHPEPSLQQTALWVATHHPDWTQSLTSFLVQQLNQAALAEKDAALLSDILISFCGNTDMQLFIADQFRHGKQQKQLFLLTAMQACEEEAFPMSWVEVLEREMQQSDDPEVISAMLDLIRLRQPQELASTLDQVIRQDNFPLELRIKAIAAEGEFHSSIRADHFSFLLGKMNSLENIPLQQLCADIIGREKRTEDQLDQLVEHFLSEADPFLLPRLLPAFVGSQKIDHGKALADALLDMPSLDNFTETQIESAFSTYPSEIQPKVKQLIAKLNQDRADRLGRIQELEALLEKGDEGRGRELYFGKAICWTCHMMGDQGGTLGPDLTSIQKDRSVHDILEAVLYPSVSFVREYETYEVKTADQTFLGIIQERSPEALVLGIGPEASVRLLKSDISSIQPKDISMMPQGLGELLSDQEIADLTAFLLGNDLIYW